MGTGLAGFLPAKALTAVAVSSGRMSGLHSCLLARQGKQSPPTQTRAKNAMQEVAVGPGEAAVCGGSLRGRCVAMGAALLEPSAGLAKIASGEAMRWQPRHPRLPLPAVAARLGP